MRKIIPKKFAIIGDPISHSLSPAMHNAAFHAKKLPYRYSRLRIRARGLKSFFKNLRSGGYLGLNVTIPHKEAVLPFLDEISREARLIGAVNTILIKEGRLIGHNTDGEGYLRSLKKELSFSPRGKRVVLLGAGGAARALLTSFCLKGVKELTLVNRTPSRAATLTKEFQKKFPRVKVRAHSLKGKNLCPLFQRSDLLINATRVGLKNEKFSSLPLKELPTHAIVSDIIYKPAMTPLLKEARGLGYKIHPGLGMLLHQGALSFELWTGKKAPFSIMKRAVSV